MPADSHTPDDLVHRDLELLAAARAELGKVYIGHPEVVEQLITCVIASGHALLEGPPGLGKTLLVRTMADVAGLSFSRIQFTPDLMPADVTGAHMLVHDGAGRASTRFQPGPLFGQLVLADEINRATPKTQSALLEAMQERTVTVGGTEHKMERPFFVFATQNPFEMEGTYTLPEAQIDRFFSKILIEYPSEDVLDAILDQTTGASVASVESVMTPADVLRLQERVREVPIASHVRRLIAGFVLSTIPSKPGADPRVRKYVRFGVSPRGGQTLVLAAKARALLEGRFNVAIDDVRAVLCPALRHRLQLNFEGVADGIDVDALLIETFDRHANTVASA